MRASRHFPQARLRAAAAQSPSHCVRGEGSSGKGSLPRTHQPKKVTPVWRGTHNSFCDSKKHKKSWHETNPLIISTEPWSFCVAKTEISHGEDLSPAWRNKWEGKLLQSTWTARAQDWPSVGKDLNSILPLPSVCAHSFGWAKLDNTHRWFSTQDCQSTVLFWDRYSGVFPRVICVFRLKQEIMVLGFLSNYSKINNLNGFFPFIRLYLSWHKFPHCCSWPARITIE